MLDGVTEVCRNRAWRRLRPAASASKDGATAGAGGDGGDGVAAGASDELRGRASAESRVASASSVREIALWSVRVTDACTRAVACLAAEDRSDSGSDGTSARLNRMVVSVSVRNGNASVGAGAAATSVTGTDTLGTDTGVPAVEEEEAGTLALSSLVRRCARVPV